MTDDADELIAIDRAALERWIRADTTGWAQNAEPDVTYFDTYAPARIDGSRELTRHLTMIAENMKAMLRARGKSQLDRHEMLRPRVQQFGDVAVLSYDWVVYIDSDSQRWRATMVYRRQGNAWRVIHAHWSIVQPPPAPPAQS